MSQLSSCSYRGRRYRNGRYNITCLPACYVCFFRHLQTVEKFLKYVVFYISQCPGPCLSPDIFETSSRENSRAAIFRTVCSSGLGAAAPDYHEKLLSRPQIAHTISIQVPFKFSQNMTLEAWPTS